MSRQATTDFPVHELIARRWSPCGFSARPVLASDLCSLFEAARWAASSYNEQPWSYIVATRDNPDEFERMLSCLVETNRDWAAAAPVLVISVARLNFARNGRPNAAALHDLGLAAGNLSLEATARGLSVHQMIGISPETARELYEIPADAQAVTAMAIGYADDPENLSEALRKRDLAPRTRKPITSFVFSGRWDEVSPIVAR